MNRDYPYTSLTISPLSQFGILLALFGAGFLLGGIATLLIAQAVLHLPLLQLGDALNKSDNLALLRWLQFAGTFCMFALPAFVFARIVNRRPLRYIGFNNHLNLRQLFIVLLLVFAALYAQSTFSELNQMIPLPDNLRNTFKHLDEQYTQQVMAMARMNNATDYILSLLMLALLPAIFEEMFFRGAMQQMFVKLFRNAFAGILLTSLIFSIAHFSFEGFLTRLFLGMMLGYIFYYGKNIWLNILAHFLNNAVVVTSIYMLSREGKLTAESMRDETYPVYVGILAIIAIFALFVFYKRECMNVVPAIAAQDSESENAFHIH
ncbi:CPBP family intramembrane metalloprotease [Ilyomonas limi]|uniref:CPBP family intramembrane metalloprotease n=1 Tax=Ilyomonas limi TaxID=2575867 RepID=A0A4U3KYB1_9BACT|nr:CPBP family intramembrane glutamic endopeptidase [Ilyomonas limi]TKK67701.1 CPBP family intramembrane metalloprotease [Ilyomonas limi]